MRTLHFLLHLQEVAETMEKQGLKEEAIEFYTQVNKQPAAWTAMRHTCLD